MPNFKKTITNKNKVNIVMKKYILKKRLYLLLFII